MKIVILSVILSIIGLKSGVVSHKQSPLPETSQTNSVHPARSFTKTEDKDDALKIRLVSPPIPSCNITVAITIFGPETRQQNRKNVTTEATNEDMLRLRRQIELILVLIKSILIQTKFSTAPDEEDACVEILVLSDTTEYFDIIQKRIFQLEKWDTSFTKFMKLKLVQAKFPAGMTHMRNLYRPGAALRLFLAEVLVNHEMVLYTDTDVIVIQGLQEIWNESQFFTNKTVLGMGKNAYKGYEVDSSALLMNLTRMRETKFIEKMDEVVKTMPRRVPRFDQNILKFYFRKYPDEIHYLPCRWNFRRSHCLRSPKQQCHDKKLTTDGILSLHGCAHMFTEYPKATVFRSVFLAYQAAKLNANFSLKIFSRNLKTALRLTVNKTSNAYCAQTPAMGNNILKALTKLQMQ